MLIFKRLMAGYYKKKHCNKGMGFLKFISSTFKALTTSRKVITRPVGRPPKNGALLLTLVAPAKSKRNPMSSLDARFDQLGH